MNLIAKILVSILCVGFFASVLADVDADTSVKPVLKIHHWKTKNGARVYFVAAPKLPMVDIQVVFDAGSVRDGDLAGLAQATSNMLNEGAGTLNADQIAAGFENVGAQYGANANRDMTRLHLRSLTNEKFLNPALKTFVKVLTVPIFPTDAWERVQKQMLLALEAEKQSPSQIARNVFYKNLYGNQPYAHPVNGTTETITHLTTKDLESFYKQYYVAHNAIIAIVGALTRVEAANIAEQLSANLPTGKAAKPLLMAVGPRQAYTQSIAFPSQQTTIFLGQVGINQLDPDYFPLHVGNYILGGGVLVSRLFQEVRDKRGLTYGVNSGFYTLAAQGPFFIVLQSRSAQANKAISVVQRVLHTFVEEGPSEQELTAAKQSIIGEFPLHFSSNEDVMENLVELAFYHLPLDYYDTYRQKISEVTIEQVSDAFQGHIHPNTMTLITVGGTAN